MQQRHQIPFLYLYSHEIPPCFVGKSLTELHGLSHIRIPRFYEQGIFTIDQLIQRLVEKERSGMPAEQWMQFTMGYLKGRIRSTTAVVHIRTEQAYYREMQNLNLAFSGLTVC